MNHNTEACSCWECLISSFITRKKEEKRQKGQRPTGIEPRPRGDRAGFGSLGQPIPDRQVPLDTAPVVEWLGDISRPQPHATSHTDAGRQNTQTPSRKAKRIVKRKKKKNLYAQRSILGFSVDPIARPGFPWVFLCGYRQLERATGGVYASAIQGCGPCLRVPDLAVAFVVRSRATWEVPSQVTSRCLADQAITKWAARC